MAKKNRDDPLLELLARANPNPDRAGCVSNELLRGLADGTVALSDPVFEHVTQCFPCYQQFGLFRAMVRKAASRRNLLILAVLLPGSALAYLWSRWRVDSLDVARTAGPMRLQLDLRRFTVMRSEAAQAEARLLMVPRRRVLLTLTLPVGSEPGAYAVQVAKAGSVIAATGTATLVDGLTLLAVELDLRDLLPGDARLAVRRDGFDWRFYPLTLE